MSTSPVAWRSRGVLCVVILCAACMVYYHLLLFVPRAHEIRTAQGFGRGYSFGADFYPIWLTSRESLLHHRDPYSAEITQQIQIGLFGRPISIDEPAALQDYRTFAYPAFTNVLFWPFALLPFSVVRVMLALILSAATVLSVLLWLQALHFRASPVNLTVLLLLTLSSYAVLEGLFAEQIGLLVGFLVAAALAALVAQKQRIFLAGSLLALTFIKPQMTLLVSAYLLLWCLARWRDRWRFAAGFLVMSALLLVSSLLVWPRWIPEWLRVMAGYRQYSTPPLVCYLLGNRLGPRLGPFLIAAMLVSALTLAWRMRHAPATSAEFAITISLLLAITAITLLPGQAVHDHVMLLPGILLIAFSWRNFTTSKPFRILLAVTALALFWQWIFAPVVIAARLWVSRDSSHDFFTSTMILLPIRTAASIPFGVCALLGLMCARTDVCRPRRKLLARNVSQAEKKRHASVKPVSS